MATCLFGRFPFFVSPSPGSGVVLRTELSRGFFDDEEGDAVPSSDLFSVILTADLGGNVFLSRVATRG